MAYTVERAALLTNQLAKLATSQAHQLAGQLANLEFWLDETAHALRVIDQYPQRFARLRDAQASWVEAHGSQGFVVSCPLCGGRPCELAGSGPPPAPTRLSSSELDGARRSLVDAAYHLLLRLHRAGLIDEPKLRAACDRVGTSIDLDDLTR